jgi:hypothetical protein
LHRRVRSLAGPVRPVRRLEGTTVCKVDRTWCASGHVRPDTSGRDGSLLDSNQTLALSRPVVVWSASGRCFAGARRYALGVSGRLGSMSGRSFDRWNAVSTIEIGRSRLNLEGHVDGAGRSDTVERVRSVSTGASGRPEKSLVKGYNGSICLECL